jgi:hypothetical protein
VTSTDAAHLTATADRSTVAMPWRLSWRADPDALPLANRHYNRQSPESAQFVPPGRCVVLTGGDPVSALWVTSWPLAEYTRHAWPRAWVCSCFRREAGPPASVMIRAAVAATRAVLGDPPALGMVTFIDRSQVRPTIRRGVATWGYTYRLAGFVDAGETAGGLLALLLPPESMPPPESPVGHGPGLFAPRQSE